MSTIGRMTVGPIVCGGRPRLRGVRIDVKDVLDLLAARAIRDDCPYLKPDDITAVLEFTTRRNDHPVLRSAQVRFLVDAQVPPALARRLTWLTVYAVAMAYVEAVVVVYLRAIYYPHGFDFPLALMPSGMAAIEIGREAATLVMLFGVAALASADRWEWFLAFCLSFGVWDIFYYVWLWTLVRWPPSLFTWDLLFLIPVPWIGPVLAPLLVSVALVAGSLLMLRLKAQGVRLKFSAPLWTLAVAGGLLVLASFVLDFASVLRQTEPPPFRWSVFAAGVGLAMTAVAVGVSRLESPS